MLFADWLYIDTSLTQLFAYSYDNSEIINHIDLQDIYVLKYLKELFKQIMFNCVIYDKFLPMTIEINYSKYQK